jgi:hypothetical protein
VVLELCHDLVHSIVDVLYGWTPERAVLWTAQIAGLAEGIEDCFCVVEIGLPAQSIIVCGIDRS